MPIVHIACLTLPSRGRHKGYALAPPLMSNVRPLVIVPPTYSGYSRFVSSAGLVGMAAIAYAGSNALGSALSKGLVAVGTMRTRHPRGVQLEYVPWTLAAPFVAELMFLFFCCAALAFPRLQFLVGGAHPFLASLLAICLLPFTFAFSSSIVGNIAFVPFAVLVLALLRKLRPVEPRREPEA
jgi:hypothetical protein